MNDPDDDLRELADWLRTSSSAEWCSKPLERAADAIDELLELRAKVAAYKQLDAAQCAQLMRYAKEDRRDHAARATLESERTANAELTEMCMRLERMLAVGPVMPKVPSETVVNAVFAENGFPLPSYQQAEAFKARTWRHVRNALLKEQGK